jgi:hypothetical protein
MPPRGSPISRGCRRAIKSGSEPNQPTLRSVGLRILAPDQNAIRPGAYPENVVGLLWNIVPCCAAMNLAAVVRGLVDRKKLAPAMGLRREQRIVLAQSVGFPAA